MSNEDLFAAGLEIRILTAIVAKTARRALELHPNLAQVGVSGLQFWILHALCHQEMTISELSRSLMLDPSTLVPSVDALERKGLAQRGQDPTDRRRVPLSVTERGRELVASVTLLDEDDLLLKSVNALGQDRALQLLFLLRGLVGHLPDGDDILHQVSTRMQTYLSRGQLD